MFEGSCKSCGGTLSPWLYMPIDAKKDEPTSHSQVMRCSKCGLGTLSPLPDASEIAGFYDLGSYYTHGESHIREMPSSLFDRVLTKLAWTADKSQTFRPTAVAKILPPKARICDLGCGHALYLREFQELGFEVVGVEPDETARNAAIGAGVRVLAGTAEDIPDGLGDFDLVIMTHSLEHCRDPLKAMENAFKLTRQGGLCYIEVPNCDCEHFRTFTVCSEMFDSPRHIYFFERRNLSRLAERVGFVVERFLFGGYVRDFGVGWRAWEREIAARIRGADPSARPTRHSFTASLLLFLRSFWRTPERKYDCVGVWLKAPAN